MKRKFYLILPDIRSCHNVGAMFRTADAFGVDKIFLVGYTGTPPKPQIDKVSLGAEKWIEWEQKKDLQDLVSELKKDGVFVVGLEKSNESIKIQELRLPARGWFGKIVDEDKDIALIVGNEVDGIPERFLAMCDNVVHIEMYGKKESLNVSVAAGIAMYVIKTKIAG